MAVGRRLPDSSRSSAGMEIAGRKNDYGTHRYNGNFIGVQQDWKYIFIFNIFKDVIVRLQFIEENHLLVIKQMDIAADNRLKGNNCVARCVSIVCSGWERRWCEPRWRLRRGRHPADHSRPSFRNLRHERAVLKCLCSGRAKNAVIFTCPSYGESAFVLFYFPLYFMSVLV